MSGGGTRAGRVGNRLRGSPRGCWYKCIEPARHLDSSDKTTASHCLPDACTLASSVIELARKEGRWVPAGQHSRAISGVSVSVLDRQGSSFTTAGSTPPTPRSPRTPRTPRLPPALRMPSGRLASQAVDAPRTPVGRTPSGVRQVSCDFGGARESRELTDSRGSTGSSEQATPRRQPAMPHLPEEESPAQEESPADAGVARELHRGDGAGNSGGGSAP